MRDFKAKGNINVNGDIIINDYSSQQNKPLIECNVEELKEEFEHRHELLEEERERKKAESSFHLKIALVVGLVIATWYFIAGNTHFAMFIIGFLGVVVPILTAKDISNETTEFETRQLETLKEIEYLLRKRR